MSLPARAAVPALRIGAEQARRFLVRRHLLAPARALPAEPESVLRVVERLGSLQFDPLEIPGARNHDLVLHARIAGYRRAWCDRWLYGTAKDPGDRRLIELYNKSLNILPLEELPFHRVTWDRTARQYRDGILRDQAATVEAVLERIARDGPLSTDAFRLDHGHAVAWWWGPSTPAARAVMEALFVSGRLGIARRDGNRRFYDLIERLVPAPLLERREPEEAALEHRLLSRYRAVGLTAPVGTVSEVMYGTGTAADRARRTAALVERGLLLPVEVDGVKGTRYLIADEEPILHASAGPAPPATVALIAPLDPIVWDRRMLRELWGFDYLWEVYVPAARRRWGYYVLPLLFGERFVGRIEPRLERTTRTLRIAGIWFEPGFVPLDEAGFLPALRDALATYRSFVGARRLAWPRTRVGREVASRLRALG